ncbi:hypothetical protein LI99_00180 [Mycolicibacterium smegmatis]|uniref:Uncharacterized protein n=2 Tax=Mycolicibacterium smegmatis (strain ATCC 700084 / mc(2)155) TaxID=246196 RepID=A0QNG8_MYCS2|nr:hypothetical protein MSMEG_0036 [Mycolicibacterium smegmatis MC2 155]AIU11945.1 hypothetical protein LI99_00180 [Mycolicibacterium smegmatis]AFP36521.1 hypothetical protein MSMEI_0038 [Mycolicibacterium smegmatis MC2 155]AIU05320.1 hypothetical protein LJ00_00180 [Mycolicibacterium smegmatis MC2 155]AIU18569.1 hypothetical protein LI98_00180 [Mycolicibacterium smegmatis]
MTEAAYHCARPDPKPAAQARVDLAAEQLASSRSCH